MDVTTRLLECCKVMGLVETSYIVSDRVYLSFIFFTFIISKMLSVDSNERKRGNHPSRMREREKIIEV